MLTEESTVVTKTLELCQTIVDSPDMRSIRTRIDAFMGDSDARSQYESLVNKGQELQDKQQRSMPLSQDEIATFEKQRDALLSNPVARGFIDAQEELHEVKETVTRYVNRTLELGRVPTEEDLGSCGQGCSCSH